MKSTAAVWSWNNASLGKGPMSILQASVAKGEQFHLRFNNSETADIHSTLYWLNRTVVTVVMTYLIMLPDALADIHMSVSRWTVSTVSDYTELLSFQAREPSSQPYWGCLQPCQREASAASKQCFPSAHLRVASSKRSPFSLCVFWACWKHQVQPRLGHAWDTNTTNTK